MLKTHLIQTCCQVPDDVPPLRLLTQDAPLPLSSVLDAWDQLDDPHPQHPHGHHHDRSQPLRQQQ